VHSIPLVASFELEGVSSNSTHHLCADVHLLAMFTVLSERIGILLVEDKRCAGVSAKNAKLGRNQPENCTGHRWAVRKCLLDVWP
jgi:hypothetical protein